MESFLWCYEHGSSTIYGQSAERDGRGTLYCSGWNRWRNDCRIEENPAAPPPPWPVHIPQAR